MFSVAERRGRRSLQWVIGNRAIVPDIPLNRNFPFRAPLNIRRAEDREKIFRQIKQNSARVVVPTRRDFVKYDGKDSVEISCDEFLEVPL